MAASTLPAHVRALRRVGAYQRDIGQVELVQTHISYVFLTDDEVFKFKKPIDAGFADFRTLAARKHDCEEEVRLNRRGCADTYLGVVPVTRRGSRYHFGGDGEVVDYAVHMRRLPAEGMLDGLLARDAASFDMVGRLVARIAEMHEDAPRSAAISAAGGFEGIARNWRESIAVETFIGRTLSRRRWQRLTAFGEGFLERERSLLEGRAGAGWVRECHGDLRSDAVCFDAHGGGNICLFDCIEFNEAYRYIDTAQDVAFLAMDLDYRGRPDLSDLLVGLYAAAIGDRELPLLLSFYKCYRACVRGRVEGRLLDQPEVSRAQKAAARRRAQAYYLLAESYAGTVKRPRAVAVLVMGASGSGKSVLAGALASRLGAVLLSTDMLRRERFGRPAHRRSDELDAGAYRPEARLQVYDDLLRLVAAYAAAGRDMVIDGTYVERAQRAQLVELSARLRLPLRVIECTAPDSVVRERQARRQAEAWSTSDGRYEVYAAQQARYEPPDELPPSRCIVIETTEPVALQLEAAAAFARQPAGNNST